MKHLGKRALATVAMLAVAVPVVMAEDSTLNRITVQFGGAHAMSADTRDGTSTNGFFAALEYNPTMSHMTQDKNESAIQLGWMRFGSGDDRVDAISLQFLQRFALGQQGWSSPNGTFYLGTGIGFTMAQIHSTGVPQGTGTGTGGGGERPRFGSMKPLLPGGVAGSANGTRLSAQILVGYRFNMKSQLELAYRFAGTVDGVRTDALTLSFGFKF